MKKFIPTIIRVILTLALCYGAYTETGIWTAIFLFLLFLSIEFATIMIRKMVQFENNQS